MAWSKPPQELLLAFEAAFPAAEDVVRRRMFGYPAAFANGNLFMGLHQADFIVRLSPSDRAEFAKAYGQRTFEPMPGRSMREYVTLPPEVIADAGERAFWVSLAVRHARALPEKASSRPRRGQAQ